MYQLPPESMADVMLQIQVCGAGIESIAKRRDKHRFGGWGGSLGL